MNNSPNVAASYPADVFEICFLVRHAVLVQAPNIETARQIAKSMVDERRGDKLLSIKSQEVLAKEAKQ